MVKDVIISLIGRLINDPRLLQQISPHGTANDEILCVEGDFDVLAETRGVVVSRRFRVACETRMRGRKTSFPYI